MDKGAKYNVDTDPDFDANFYKNIEKVLSDAYIDPGDEADTAVEAEANDNDEAVDEADTADDAVTSDEDRSIEEEAYTETAVAEEAISAEEADGHDEKEGYDEAALNTEAAVTADATHMSDVFADEADLDELMLRDEVSAALSGNLAYEDIPQLSDQMELEDEISQNVDDALIDINASLAKQIDEELGQLDTQNGKKKMSKGKKAIIAALITLVCLVGFGAFMAFTKPGHQLAVNISGLIWVTMTDEFEKDPVQMEDIDHIEESDLESDEEDIDVTTIKWPDHPGEGRQEEGVYNILLLGEEAIGSGSARGRTDLIIVATMNTNTKELKLTSLMRDTLVKIPGYLENKLNTAYEKGGLDLLYETISMNYNIRLDGCVMVNFESFEKIIDKLGGIEITLTASEAKYLNRTNYISKPQYRNVVEGKQLMNGNQVLGYTRVRKRANINGNNNDYGRTERHRIVLEAIFEKYKTKSKIELGTLMFSFLPMFTTDIDKATFEMLLNHFIEMGTTKIDQLRLPADGTFTDNVEVRGMDVLIPEWDKNITLFHNFVFGDDKTAAQKQ